MFFVPVHYTGGEKSNTFRGYTLIEVVVAIAIFSAMLLLGGMALNQGLKQYQGLIEKGFCFWDYAQNIWTDKSFHSTIDYYVHTDTQGWFPYFKGDQEGISFVTLAPFAGDMPVVMWIRKENVENGKEKLIYYELPVYAKSYRELEDDFTSGAYKKGRSIRILEGIDRVQFEFYGYDIRDGKHKWSRIYNGEQMKRLPMLVRIEYMQGGLKKMLTYAIHVNSLIKWDYTGNYAR
ncbi:MAG: prepilin-type N-terminal cleavage/methylation domain-containing protein [Smithella sp.]|jgi:general secretion pathway protein J